MRCIILCAALTASAFLGATTAAYSEDGQMVVRFGGAGFHNDAGASLALARIRHASAQFCGDGSGRTTLKQLDLIRKCEAAMTDRAVRQLDAPLVTALYEHHPMRAPETTVAQGAGSEATPSGTN